MADGWKKIEVRFWGTSYLVGYSYQRCGRYIIFKNNRCIHIYSKKIVHIHTKTQGIIQIHNNIIEITHNQ